MTDAHPDAQAHEQWQRERTAYVTGPGGNLALVDYEPLSERDTRLDTLPATGRVDRSAQGAWLTLDEDVEASIDGESVSGHVFLARLRGDGTPLLRLGTRTIDAFSLDGSDYELRIYDSTASTLSEFDRIDVYPYDPEWVIEGRYEAYEQTDSVAWGFTRDSDTGHAKKVPGVIHVEVRGQSCSLLGFLDGTHMVLVFADGTTGPESYQPGRFLRFPCPERSGPVTVDFNRTFVPPCGFSAFYSCPIPPAQNRIDAPVRAGERAVVWKHGAAH